MLCFAFFWVTETFNSNANDRQIYIFANNGMDGMDWVEWVRSPFAFGYVYIYLGYVGSVWYVLVEGNCSTFVVWYITISSCYCNFYTRWKMFRVVYVYWRCVIHDPFHISIRFIDSTPDKCFLFHDLKNLKGKTVSLISSLDLPFHG